MLFNRIYRSQNKNKRGTIVSLLGKKGIEKQLYDAEVNHCLSFDQVSDELIEFYNIPEGDFDTISTCKYTVPNFMDIGKLYSIMIEDCAEEGKEVDELIAIFSSFISDEISNFNTDLYYQNPSYLECSYRRTFIRLICYSLRETNEKEILPYPICSVVAVFKMLIHLKHALKPHLGSNILFCIPGSEGMNAQ